MQALEFKKLANISDGYAYLIYPAVGCGSFTCIQYIENPDSSYGDLGKSCLRGALHSANPAFNVVGRVAANPYIRYDATQKAADRFIPLNQEDDFFDGQAGFGE